MNSSSGMPYLWSVVLGVSMKLFDDWIDLKITGWPIVLDICKILMTLSTYLIVNEYYILNLSVIGSLLLSNSIKRFDDPFWDAYLGFVAGLAVMNISNLPTICEHWQIKLLLVCYVYLSSYIEEITYLEEMSKDKLVARGYGILINFGLLLGLEYFDMVDTYALDFFVCLILFVNSYLITNIVVQIIYARSQLKSNSEQPLLPLQQAPDPDPDPDAAAAPPPTPTPDSVLGIK